MDKALQYLRAAYPKVKWSLGQPDKSIIENFGPGSILKGYYSEREESFFILEEDKNKRKWGDIIAAKLTGTESEEPDAR